MTFDNSQNYKKYWKKTSYTIKVSKPAIGMKVFNNLELSSYVTDKKRPFVLTGTVGENWVVDIDKLNSTYENVNEPSRLIDDSSFETMEEIQIRPKKSNDFIWAVLVPVSEKGSISTSWGDTLNYNADGISHADGDYIVCMSKDGEPNLEDRWVVNGAVFVNTYTDICED